MATKPNSPGVLRWTASEYIDHQQGATWYLMLALVTAALSAAFYLLLKDYFSSAAVIIIGAAVGAFAHRTPRQLSYEISAQGFKIADKPFGFDQFKSFAIIPGGPVSSIELDPIKRFMPPISVFFATKDQEAIITLLQEHLPYEERQLDAVERISRRLKF